MLRRLSGLLRRLSGLLRRRRRRRGKSSGI